jgi:c-di-GMP-binding flagellar brake protein YcgR
MERSAPIKRGHPSGNSSNFLVDFSRWIAKIERSDALKPGRFAMERRKHQRIDASHPVLYYSDIYPRPKVAATLDLSLGGARIETRYPLMKSEGLEIAIAIKPQVIKCRGRVMYVIDSKGERLRVGVRFEDLSWQDSVSLGHYLSSMREQRV